MTSPPDENPGPANSSKRGEKWSIHLGHPSRNDSARHVPHGDLILGPDEPIRAATGTIGRSGNPPPEVPMNILLASRIRPQVSRVAFPLASLLVCLAGCAGSSDESGSAGNSGSGRGGTSSTAGSGQAGSSQAGTTGAAGASGAAGTTGVAGSGDAGRAGNGGAGMAGSSAGAGGRGGSGGRGTAGGGGGTT